MRHYRSLVALMVILSMLLVLSVTAGAAPFSDVDEDADHAPAFQLLKDLNIFEGYGDGTVGPNDPLTRQQFAVVVVRALGATNVASNLSNFVTRFADNDQISDWARGAVAYASARIVQGYPDGTFRPQANVTYAEAYTMLIRALGLEPAVEGPWPIGVINLAHEIDLSDGISGDANAPITRGDMAIATENALLSSWYWDEEAEELAYDGSGRKSLIVKKHKWNTSDWSERVGLRKVTGKFDRITAGGDIRVEGRNYEIDNYATLRIELNESVTAASARVNLGNSTWTPEKLGELLDVVDPVSVTLFLDADTDKVIKIDVTVDTFANWELTRVNVTRDETDFGDVRVRIPGQPQRDVEVTDETEVFVNGKKASLAEAREALEAFRDEWGSRANAVATVRTVGDDPAAKAIWVSILTDTAVSGTVTGQGRDSEGDYVRIDGTKYYYGDENVQRVNVDTEVTVLLGHDDKIYVVLDGRRAIAADTWARVINYTVAGNGDYVATFQLADNTQFTLRVKENDSHVYDPTPGDPASGDERDVNWQKQINDALADNLSPHLIFVHFDGNDVKAMVASKNWDDYPHSAADVESGRVVSISATRIVLNAGTFTLAPDVFYWDRDNEEFIRRADIAVNDVVTVFIADGLVHALVLGP